MSRQCAILIVEAWRKGRGSAKDFHNLEKFGGERKYLKYPNLRKKKHKNLRMSRGVKDVTTFLNRLRYKEAIRTFSREKKPLYPHVAPGGGERRLLKY